MTRHVETTRDGAVLEVRLDKPKVNAIDHAMSRELGEAFRTLRDDPELRVAILTATGDRIFSAAGTSRPSTRARRSSTSGGPTVTTAKAASPA